MLNDSNILIYAAEPGQQHLDISSTQRGLFGKREPIEVLAIRAS